MSKKKTYYEELTALAERYRNLKSLQTVQGINKKFLALEDANFHSENAILLAVHYGTERQLEKTKELMVKHSSYEVKPKERMKAYYSRCELTNKLYKKHTKKLDK